MNILLLLPNQLFAEIPKILFDKIILYEHPAFFTDFKFHKSKLLYHRVTMKSYFNYLQKKFKSNADITYIDFNKKYTKDILNKNNHLYFYDPVDHSIEKELKKINSNYTMMDSILFIETIDELKSFATNKKKFTHNSFYIWQRRKLNLLLSNNKPVGGKWSFDVENRLKFPDDYKDSLKIKFISNNLINQSKKYIDTYFNKNYGECNIYLPFTHSQAKTHFKKFLKQRLSCFGPYQDAVDKNIHFACHSVISPMLNIGLLDIRFVLDETIKFYNKHKSSQLLKSVEAFIRQVIGWRSYVRMLYHFKFKELESSNFFKHKNKLSYHWYNGNLGFPPVDDVIHKIIKTAYAHHIERLMYCGNLMLLLCIHPKYIYQWFMELFIDSYNWVMLPNVHGMSQFSAGNLMMTRPYFSSSNYIFNMTHYNKNETIYINKNIYKWADVWDALYYSFINDNYKFLSKNYSTARSTAHWKNKSNNEQKNLISIANIYFKSIKN
jgi:deoxyribodipyrimidine photolyase-related protein